MHMGRFLVIQPEQSKTKEKEQVENEKLIKMKPSELVASNEDGFSMVSFNFIDFVVQVNEDIKVFLVEFDSCNLGKSTYSKG